MKNLRFEFIFIDLTEGSGLNLQFHSNERKILIPNIYINLKNETCRVK